MTAPITITMLGGTKTGKTCFLVGMYGIMRRGVRGFTFAAHDMDDDLKLAKDWKNLRATGANRWPASTDQSKDYAFDFCYAFDPLRQFTWHDYRGGALDSVSSDTDKQGLIERLRKSSCVLVCFSAAHLTNASGVVTEDGEDEAALLNQYLKQVREAARARGEAPPAVVIVLTKFDLVAGRPREEILAQIRDLFHPLYAPGGGWTITTCPVSLGKALASNAADGEVAPVNVHLPVSFALYYTIQQEIEATQAQLSHVQRQVAEAAGKNWFQRWWEGIDSVGRQMAAQRTKAQLAELHDKLQLLFRELVDGVEIYHNGEEIEANV